MNIEKYQTLDGHCIIKSDTYVHTAEYISQLVAIAKKDFPGLQDKDISVKVFNSDRWKSQTGIEFNAKSQPGYYVQAKTVKPPVGAEYEVIETCSHPEYKLLYELPYVFN